MSDANRGSLSRIGPGTVGKNMALRRLQAIIKGKLVTAGPQPASSLPVNMPSVRRGYFNIQRSFSEEWIVVLSGNEWKIFCTLVCDADRRGCSWHSALSLAQRTGMCRDTAEKALRVLVEKGLLTRTIRETRGPITLYVFTLATSPDGVLDIHRRQQEKAAVSKKVTAGKTSRLEKANGRIFRKQQPEFPALSNIKKKEAFSPLPGVAPEASDAAAAGAEPKPREVENFISQGGVLPSIGEAAHAQGTPTNGDPILDLPQFLTGEL